VMPKTKLQISNLTRPLPIIVSFIIDSLGVGC
jgi:hypothetical protein